MTDIARKLKRAVQRHGIIGLLGVVAGHVLLRVNWLLPSIRAQIRERKKRAMAFDEQFGVNTAGRIHQTRLKINNPNQLHAVLYEGSDPKYFRDAINALPIDYERFVLIDFGSGKGRAILLASEFPFKRIVGVEFSEELHRIAQENIRRFHSDKCKCKLIESICMDAIAYQLPNDHLVCYFFNPFDETLMAQMLANIRDFLSQNPREIFIVYYNPREGHLID
ncbi:MAG: class I SAM-dependent methyltransferase, partial [Candidatus Atribacteria bacterium]|nr:class I SAM-dependent methyltransferase [Candidatus Atribacteria bacterium]